MAVAISQVYAGATTNGGARVFGTGITGFTSGSFTPTDNSLLVVVLNTANDNSTPSNASNTVAAIGLSGGGLTWTKQSAISFFNTFSLTYQSGCVVFTAPVATGASMTLTSSGYLSNSGTNTFAWYITAYCVTGYNTSTPIGATALNNNNTSQTPTLTLSGAPASSSLVLSCTNTGISTSSTGVTAGGSYTRITNYTDTNGYFTLGAEYLTGTTSTSVPWGSIDAGDTGVPGNNSGQFAVEFLAPGASNPTPTDCSFLFIAPTLPRRPINIALQERKGFSPQDSATPAQLAFWFQSPFLGPTPKSTQNTNQAFFISPQEPKTPTSALTFRPHALLRHIPTIYTAQSFVCNPTIGPPVPVDAFWVQPPDLLNHPHSLDTNQPKDNLFAGWTNNTPTSLGFWTQPQDLLRHKATLDTNQPVAAFIAPAAPVPSNQVNEYWSFAPIGHLAIGQGTLPTGTPTPSDCSFLFQPSALLNHPQTLDTNQPKDNFFAGWEQNQTPTALGFWAQTPNLLCHPSTVDTNQSFDAGFAGQANVTPTALGFWTQAANLLDHPNTVDTRQQFEFAPPVLGPTPADCSFLFQPTALLKHPVTLDTNQRVVIVLLETGFCTNFPVTENPISVGGKIITSTSPGVNWSDLGLGGSGTKPVAPVAVVSPGLAGPPNIADPSTGDALAVATGTWSPDQSAQVVVANIAPTATGYSEFEIHLRTDAATGFGYEITWGYNHDYLMIVTWFAHGYSILAQPTGAQYHINPGDVLSASIIGNVITVYTNGAQVYQYVDNANSYTVGNPGFGFNEGAADPYGISSFCAAPGTGAIFEAATPSALGFWTQAPDLLHHPVTLDTNQPFKFNPPPRAITPADCSFLFEPAPLLNHPATLDTNQALGDTFAGWTTPLTPSSLGFWVQAPDLVHHPITIDTNQSRVSYQDRATPDSLAFWIQSPDLLHHPSTVDTNPPLDDVYAGWQVLTPTQLGFWQQPPDLLRHASTLDTNQPIDNMFSGWAQNITPTSFGFFIQAPDLLRHANTVDTNQPFEFNPPLPAQTPSAYWWFQPPDLLRHPTHLDTNQPRLVSQVEATPSALAWWRQPEDLFKHPATLNTQQSFKYLPPPQPPFGWLIQAQDLLRHPVPFILGMQPFAELPPVIHTNRLIKVYFFD